jgi:hypothetical protein
VEKRPPSFFSRIFHKIRAACVLGFCWQQR